MGTGTGNSRSGRIRSLACMARALGRSAPLLRLLEAAAEETVDAVDAASVSVSRLEPGTRTVRTLVNVGELGPTEERWPQDETYDIDEFVNLPGFADQNLPWRADVREPGGDPKERQLLLELGKAAAIGAPLIVDGQPWGELYATRRLDQPPYGEDDLSYLMALAAILAGAISRAQREEALHALAYQDALTGLANRRALDERAARCFRPEGRRPKQVTVVVVDVNNLKQVNDSAGHQAGDRLLRAIADAMVQRFAGLPGATVARVGGDEFTVLVSGHPGEAVLEAADALCATSWSVGGPGQVSCGAATVRLDADTMLTPADLFAAADRAQYVAKRGGLRRTVLADDLVVAHETMDA